MTGVHDEGLKAYFEAAARWDHDRLKAAVRSRTLAWILAGCASVLATASVAAGAALAPLKSVEAFVVRVDRTTGAVDVMTALSGAKTIGADEAGSKHFLAQYVRAREGWLPASAAEDFAQVAILSTPVEQRRFAEQHRVGAPTSPQVRFGIDGAAEVQIRAVSFINGQVANIRFRRIVRRAQATTTEDWIATAAFTYTRAPMLESDRLRNPLGFQVVSYRADPEAAP